MFNFDRLKLILGIISKTEIDEYTQILDIFRIIGINYDNMIYDIA